MRRARMRHIDTACLNCGATLVGRFCASCGQRAVPAHPTVRELAGDAWNELTGYDGRVAATFRALVKPGLLTRSYIEGRRARYLSPVRLYLIVSVAYFVVAASAPQLDRDDRQSVGPGLRIGVSGDRPDGSISEEDRAELLAQVDEAPWLLRSTLRSLAEDPVGFRGRLFTTMPRVFFAMLPVFAGIVAVFYRGQTFPTSLVFAVHLHAFAFVAMTVSELAKFTYVPVVAVTLGVAALVALAVYAVMAFRTVFGGGRLMTVAKLSGIGALYSVASLPAFFIIMVWAAFR